MQHYVYWLYDAVTNELLYIGRSHEPDRRKRDFERLYERSTVCPLRNRFEQFEDAQAHELAMIRKHRPPYNKRIASSPASLGKTRPPTSDATRAKMRAAKLGRVLTEEHKRNIRANATHYSHWTGTRWITDGDVNKHHPSDQALPPGWQYGRTVRRRNTTP